MLYILIHSEYSLMNLDKETWLCELSLQHDSQIPRFRILNESKILLFIGIYWFFNTKLWYWPTKDGDHW